MMTQQEFKKKYIKNVQNKLEDLFIDNRMEILDCYYCPFRPICDGNHCSETIKKNTVNEKQLLEKVKTGFSAFSRICTSNDYNCDNCVLKKCCYDISNQFQYDGALFFKMIERANDKFELQKEN